MLPQHTEQSLSHRNGTQLGTSEIFYVKGKIFGAVQDERSPNMLIFLFGRGSKTVEPKMDHTH